jgi:hypothetical protein
MKRIITIFLLAMGFASQAQVSSIPEEVNPNDSVKILVNINQLNQGLDHVQNLMAAVASGEDLYIWTWRPREHGPNHPLVNGFGSAAWKNSNPLLRMTNEGGGVFSYTMVPVDFYEVDASVVYAENIHFLVKPRDGGGFGDPDIKSEDLVLEVEPPFTVRKPAFGFPTFVQQDDIYVITYDNKRETVPGIQNAQEGEIFVFSEATLTDSTVIRITAFFNTPNNPMLQMDYIGNQMFEKIIIPSEFFNLQPGQQIASMRFIVLRNDAARSRTEDDLVQVLDCP